MPDKTFKQMFSDLVSKEDFQTAFKAIIAAVKSMNEQARAALSEVRTIADRVANMEQRIETRIAEIRDGVDGKDYVLTEEDKQAIASQIEVPIVEKVVEIVTQEVPAKDDTAAKAMKKLAELEERMNTPLDLSETLKPLEDRLTQQEQRRIQTPAKAYMVRLVDCSSQCDGSNKNFNVGGSHFGIIGVYTSQFPHALRPIIDYTVTNNGFILTDAVAPIEAGQTLTAQFLK